MNYRKFHSILCIVISIVLFTTGTSIMIYLNKSMGSEQDNSSDNLISDLLEPLKAENRPVNILVLGGDLVAGNTDTIMLVNYNPATSKINLLSVPRDTYAQVKGSDVSKINSAFPIGGGKLAVESVSNLLNVNINYYVFINTTVFKQIIDLLDGVDYYVPVDMDYEDPLQDLYIHLKRGQQHLNGEEAEGFMRFRQPNRYTSEIWEFYDGGDEKRIEAQQNFIKELIRQKANIFSISKIDDIINTVFSNLDTNLDMSDALKMVPGVSKLSISNVSMFKLPGEPVEHGLWYFEMNSDETDELVKEYFNVKEGFEESITRSGSARVTIPRDSDNDKSTDENINDSEDEFIPEKSIHEDPYINAVTSTSSTTKNDSTINPSNSNSSYYGDNSDAP